MRRLDVGMSLEGGVHAAVEFAELTRVFAEQMRPQLGDAGPHAVGIGRQIERPERADLAVADEPASVSTSTTVLSKTETDLPPDHL